MGIMIENMDHKDLDFETRVLIYKGIGVFITFLLLLCLISALFWKYDNRTLVRRGNLLESSASILVGFITSIHVITYMYIS